VPSTSTAQNTDPKCIVGGLTSNITFTLRNGSSAKSLVGWSVRKASKAAAASLRVSLDRKAARGLTSLEVCVNLPGARGQRRDERRDQQQQQQQDGKRDWKRDPKRSQGKHRAVSLAR
jgi:hypothetical protein